MGTVRSILVRAANGDELTIYEFQDRRFIGNVRRLRLCTGELVEPADDQSFVLVRSGAVLTRVRG